MLGILAALRYEIFYANSGYFKENVRWYPIWTCRDL